jgi:signal transduction histidine kinase
MDAGHVVLRHAAVHWQASGGVLFEATPPRFDRFEASAVEGLDASLDTPTFAAASLLPRWLRVNRDSLAIPDNIGVFDSLSSSEQQGLLRLGANLAVPLVQNGRLVGWLALSGCKSPARSGGASELPADSQQWAADLCAARQAADAAARAETISRSNRLSLAGRMAAGIAHEIRNPLAAVRSIIQLIRSDEVPQADCQRLLGNAIAEIDRVNTVLTGMLTLGRPSQARVESVDLIEVLADAVSVCSAYARAHGQLIQVSQTGPIFVHADRHELRQVFVNVVLNACQASSSGGRIHAEVSLEDQPDGSLEAMVRIRDSGKGIPKSVVDRVFEPFFTTKADGGGLGLTLCREAVCRHNGDVLLSSEEGVGTVVTIRLPAQGANGENIGR